MNASASAVRCLSRAHISPQFGSWLLCVCACVHVWMHAHTGARTGPDGQTGKRSIKPMHIRTDGQSDGTGRAGTGRAGPGPDRTGRDGTGRDGTGRDGTRRDGTRRTGQTDERTIGRSHGRTHFRNMGGGSDCGSCATKELADRIGKLLFGAPWSAVGSWVCEHAGTWVQAAHALTRAHTCMHSHHTHTHTRARKHTHTRTHTHTHTHALTCLHPPTRAPTHPRTHTRTRWRCP